MAIQQAAAIPVSSRYAADRPIDLAASQALVVAVRQLATRQTAAVTASIGGADKHAIDLMCLLDESVLVFEETHALLRRLAVQDEPYETAVESACLSCRDVAQGRLRAASLVTLAQIVALVFAAGYLIELLDPAPMEVAASGMRHDGPMRAVPPVLAR